MMASGEIVKQNSVADEHEKQTHVEQQRAAGRRIIKMVIIPKVACRTKNAYA